MLKKYKEHMNAIYLICVVLLFVVKIFYSSHKRNNLNQKIINRININSTLIIPPMSTKNKWLYSTDDFGKMETGVAYASQTFKRELPLAITSNDFEIINL